MLEQKKMEARKNIRKPKKIILKICQMKIGLSFVTQKEIADFLVLGFKK